MLQYFQLFFVWSFMHYVDFSFAKIEFFAILWSEDSNGIMDPLNFDKDDHDGVRRRCSFLLHSRVCHACFTTAPPTAHLDPHFATPFTPVTPPQAAENNTQLSWKLLLCLTLSESGSNVEYWVNMPITFIWLVDATNTYCRCTTGFSVNVFRSDLPQKGKVNQGT